MMGFSYDTPQRVKPAKLRPPKPQQQQQQQQQPLHTKQQQHALFIKARKDAAEAAAQQHQQQQGQGLTRRQGSLSAASKTGRLVAVTTYSGSLEDYLLLHSTDDSCSGSNSDVSSPLRGSSEEDLRSSSNLWEDHLRQQQQQQQQEEEACEAQSSRKVSSSSDGSEQQQQQQQQEQQQQQQLEEESRQVSAAAEQQEQPAASEQEQQEQQQQQHENGSTSSERRFIVPPAVRTPEAVEKRQWPALTIALMPHMSSLEDIHRIAAFTQTAAELQRVANLPIEAFSPAAAALHLQQRLKAQQLLRRPLHVTLREGLKSLCTVFKPQQTSLPPIKLPVVFPEAEEAAGTAAASREQSYKTGSGSRFCSSTLEQQHQSSSSTNGGVGSSNSSSSSSSSSRGANCEGPFEEEVSVLLRGGTTGRVVALTPDNNLVVRLPNGSQVETRPSECKFIVGGALVPPPPSPQQQQQQQGLKLPANMRGAETIPSVSQLLRKAAAEAPATHNTVALPALASVCRVSTTKPSVEVFKVKTTKKQPPPNQQEAFAAVFPADAQTQTDQPLPEDEPALDAPACALLSPGICQPRVVRSAAEALQHKAALCAKPETATYDLIKAPGIVRPLFDIVSQPSSKLQQPRRSGPELIANPQQQQQQQQGMPSFLQQVPHLTELGGPAAGPAAAAAAELDLVGQKWFSDLQHNMKHDMLQQYVDTAPPSLSGGLSAEAKSCFAATHFVSPHTERRNKARVLREEVDAMSYTLSPNQQQHLQQ